MKKVFYWIAYTIGFLFVSAFIKALGHRGGGNAGGLIFIFGVLLLFVIVCASFFSDKEKTDDDSSNENVIPESNKNLSLKEESNNVDEENSFIKNATQDQRIGILLLGASIISMIIYLFANDFSSYTMRNYEHLGIFFHLSLVFLSSGVFFMLNLFSKTMSWIKEGKKYNDKE